MTAPRATRQVLAVWPQPGWAGLRAFASAVAAIGFAMVVGGPDFRDVVSDRARLPFAAGCLFLGLLGAGVALVRGASRSDLTLGTDGISIGLRSPRFISFADIDRLERDRTAHGRAHHLAVVVLKSGERLRVGGRTDLVDPTTLTTVGEAQADLDEALERYRARMGAAHPPALPRGAREASEWLTELRALAQPGGFREQRLAPAELLAVIEDPAADPTARAGAAYALRASGLESATRRRVRVAAAATAAPQVRVALEAAADPAEDDARVAAVVADVEPGN